MSFLLYAYITHYSLWGKMRWIMNRELTDCLLDFIFWKAVLHYKGYKLDFNLSLWPFCTVNTIGSLKPPLNGYRILNLDPHFEKENFALDIQLTLIILRPKGTINNFNKSHFHVYFHSNIEFRLRPVASAYCLIKRQFHKAIS